MSNYQTETVNAQFLNQAFVDKVDQGLEKEAGQAMSAFVRQKLREEGFTRKILGPQMISSNELDRGLTDEPRIIVEKEIDSAAANMPLVGSSDIRYFTGSRYEVTFHKIASNKFTKSKFELATYRTDIRNILQENSVKDLQEREDANFYEKVVDMATANSNVHSIAGGFNIPNLQAGIKKLLAKKLPVGCILMTQEMFADLQAQPATQVGDRRASDLHEGGSMDSFFGHKIITTIKNDILPSNRALVFSQPQYLGQFYMLQDATVFLKAEADMIEFETYESVGVGIGNTNAVQVIDF